MIKYVVALALLVSAHFAGTYLVPARAGTGWLGWPFAAGDAGLLGAVGSTGVAPVQALAALAVVALLAAVLELFGLWVPHFWWRPLAIGGSAVSLALMMLFAGINRIIPIGVDAAILYFAVANIPQLTA